MIIGFYLLLSKKFSMHPYRLYAVVCLGLSMNFFFEYSVLFLFNINIIHMQMKTYYFFKIIHDNGLVNGLKMIFGSDIEFLH